LNIQELDIIDEKNFTGFKGRTICLEEAMLLESVSRFVDSSLESANACSAGIVLGVDGPVDIWKKEFFSSMIMDGPLGASPLLFPYTSHNALAARLSIEYGVRGQSLTIASGPLSFLKALCEAFRLIELGVVEAIIVGGVGIGKVATTLLSERGGEFVISGVKELSSCKKDDSSCLIYCIEDSFNLIADLMKDLSSSCKEDLRVVKCRDRYGASVSFALGYGGVGLGGGLRIAKAGI